METYYPKGVCSTGIRFCVENEVITFAEFADGCDGNLKALCVLVSGMHIDEAIRKLEGIRCGGKETSCPDQFARALRAWKQGLRRSEVAFI